MPGAASNQPPVPASAPINGSAQALQGAGAGANGSSRKEVETNYAVDKTVRVTRNASGTVRRLHAAVVVNNRTTTDPKGKSSTVPLTDAELEKLTALVQQGIGFAALQARLGHASPAATAAVWRAAAARRGPTS